MYKVLEFNEHTGQLTVQFEGSYNPIAIDIPIANNRYLEGEPLESYIEGLSPRWIQERQKAIIAGIDNVDAIKKLDTRTPDEIRRDKEIAIRTKRDNELRLSDWLVLPDTGFSEEAVSRFKKYRQELRDVPQQAGFPDNVIWPNTEGEWMNNPSWR